MKRFLLALALAMIGALAAVGVAAADGGPHGEFTTTTDGCAGCHRAHTATTGDKLLVVDQSSLCFSCHDGTGSRLDAWDGAQLGARMGSRATNGRRTGINGALKGGGFVFARIDSANATTPGAALPTSTSGIAVTSAHVKSSELNGLTAENIIWGNAAIGSGSGKDVASSPLACGDCHNPHGNGRYRLLRDTPNQGGAPTPVALTDESPKNYVTTNYWTTYQVGVTTPWTAEQMSSWCSTCHTRYLSSDEANSGDAIFKNRHKSDGTSSIGGNTGAPYGAATFSTQCLQCHVAHGGNAQLGSGSFSAGVVWPGTTTARGNESTLLKINDRGTCVGCHGTSP